MTTSALERLRKLRQQQKQQSPVTKEQSNETARRNETNTTNTSMERSSNTSNLGDGNSGTHNRGININSTRVAKQLNKDEVTEADLNEEQTTAVRMAGLGHSYCLIGPAGSGKTTTIRCVGQALEESGNIGHFGDHELTKKFVTCAGIPRIAILSFTNQAVRNIREAMPEQFKRCCSTIHNLLEFQPTDYEKELDDGSTKESMIFAPKYGTLWTNAGGEALPHIDVIVIEEASNVSLELFELLVSALPRPHETQFIFLGDLNQLPPVFEDGILGFKQLELPVVELTQVYRNVGLVTQLAHRILEGKPIHDSEAERLSTTNGQDTIKLVKFQKKYESDHATAQMGTYFKRLIESHQYDETNSIVLVPFNKKFGTIELNKWMMQGITERDDLEVHEVISLYHSSYWCVGDRVLHGKQFYIIKEILPNTGYKGKEPIPASKYLTRFGTAKRGHEDEVYGFQHNKEEEASDEVLDAILADVDDDATKQSSHILVMESIETGCILRLSTAAINNLIPGYCLTVHKAQGSEWKNVHFVLHHSHAVMAQRELLYTGITRARNNLTLYYSGNYSGNAAKNSESLLYKALKQQKIPGKTAQDKLNFFRRKARAYILAEGRGKTKEALELLDEQGKLTIVKGNE